MQRRDESGLVSICLTLVIHAGLAYLLICAFIQDQEFLLHHNPPARQHFGKGYVGIISLPELPPSPPKAPDKAQSPPKPRPQPRLKPQEQPAPNDFGEANGKGTSINSFNSDKPFQGRLGDQDQAWLSRDPAGPGRMPPVPSPFTGLPGEMGDNRPKRQGGPGGDGSPPAALASLLPPQPQTPTPFGPNAVTGPATGQAPKFVAPPPTPPPPAPVATTPPVKPPTEMIAIVEPGGPTTHPTDPHATTRPPDWVAEDLPSGPKTSLRPKIKTPATWPNDTKIEVSLSPKTQVNSPATRPAQIAADQQVHPETPKPSPSTQPSELVQAQADPARESQPKPTTRPVEVALGPVKPAPDHPSQPTEKQQETEAQRPKPSSKNPGPGGSPNAGGGRAGPPIAPADPAPMSDQESDAFSTKGTVIIAPGKIEAKLGRKVKPIKPRLPLKGQVDVVSLENPTAVFKVSIDPTGKVTDVRTLRSSGSNEIDHPTELALYQWWIEPAKNKQGKAIKDVIVLTIAWR